MWWIVVILVIALIAVATMPAPKAQPPAGINDIQTPTAEFGREVPVAFGTVDFKGPQIIYYGNLKTVAVKSKGGKKG